MANATGTQESLRRWLMKMGGSPKNARSVRLPGNALITVINPLGEQSRQPVLELRALALQRRGRPVFESSSDVEAATLSLRIWDGETVLLEAPNGWGKTTLLETIAGLNSPHRGQVLLRGAPLISASWVRRLAGLIYLPTDLLAFKSLRAKEVLALASVTAFTFPQNLLNRPVSSLSGGERQRLRMDIALAATAHDVMLYDEPLTGLDSEGIVAWMDRMASVRTAATIIAEPLYDAV